MPQRPILITLTGPEGSGKSTNQAAIVRIAHEHALVAAAVKPSELTIGHLLSTLATRTGLHGRRSRFDRELHAASPEAPTDAPPPAAASRAPDPAKPTPVPGCSLKRRLRALRRALSYPIDACVFRLYLRLRLHPPCDALVCDRYLYDAMARVVEDHPRLVRLTHRLMTRPDFAFLLSATPEALSARRAAGPAYYALSMRRFARLAPICPELIAVPPGDLDFTEQQLRTHLGPAFERRAPPAPRSSPVSNGGGGTAQP